MNLPINVLIADDHEMVREGLYMLLSESPDEITVVGQARNGTEAVHLAEQLHPDVILMDLIMPDIDGIEATRRLRTANVNSKVIILTSFAEGDRVRDAIQAGATGYLLKDVLKNDLISAIRSVAEGKPTLHPVVQQYLMQQVTTPTPPSPFESLTERERDVLRLVATGHSNKEIAVKLSLTVGTVKGYVSAILSKLEMADRTQAALYAVSNGLV